MNLPTDLENWEKCGGTGCGMMHGCADRHYEDSKADCQECADDANAAMAAASDWED